MKNNKEKKYAVIGWNGAPYCYGKAATLIGAKRLATANQYLTAFGDWAKPEIYRIEDVTKWEAWFGDTLAPKTEDTRPVATWNKEAKKWEGR